MVLIMLSIGLVVLRLSEDWDLLISAYVLTQIVTTIGYGDYTAKHAGTKIFMSCYAIAVLVVVSFYINKSMGAMVTRSSECIMNHLVSAEARLEGVSLQSQRIQRRYTFLNKLLSASLTFIIPVIVGTVGFHWLEGCTCDADDASNDCVSSSYDQCVDTGGYTQTWVDSFYMSVITLCTIGFGDYYPRNRESRIFAIVWMMLGVACTALFIDTCSKLFFDDQQYQRLIMADELVNMDENTFKEIDTDGNGYLSRGEFVTYSLIKYADVDPQVVKTLMQIFDSMEKSGDNAVTWEEVLARQQRLSETTGGRRSEV